VVKGYGRDQALCTARPQAPGPNGAVAGEAGCLGTPDSRATEGRPPGAGIVRVMPSLDGRETPLAEPLITRGAFQSLEFISCPRD
jgi:hypothetical protein